MTEKYHFNCDMNTKKNGDLEHIHFNIILPLFQTVSFS